MDDRRAACIQFRTLYATSFARRFEPTYSGPPRPLWFERQLRALSHTATLSDVRLTLDANAFEGSLTIQAGEKRPKISGTLATRVYELRTSEAGLPAMQRDRQWNKDGFAIGRLDLLDADLRLSANRLNIGRLAITDAGFVIALDDGCWKSPLPARRATAARSAADGASTRAWRHRKSRRLVQSRT